MNGTHLGSVEIYRRPSGGVETGGAHLSMWAIRQGCDLIDLADWMEEAAGNLRAYISKIDAPEQGA